VAAFVGRCIHAVNNNHNINVPPPPSPLPPPHLVLLNGQRHICCPHPPVVQVHQVLEVGQHIGAVVRLPAQRVTRQVEELQGLKGAQVTHTLQLGQLVAAWRGVWGVWRVCGRECGCVREGGGGRVSGRRCMACTWPLLSDNRNPQLHHAAPAPHGPCAFMPHPQAPACVRHFLLLPPPMDSTQRHWHQELSCWLPPATHLYAALRHAGATH
jgi:hypothetical protein